MANRNRGNKRNNNNNRGGNKGGNKNRGGNKNNNRSRFNQGIGNPNKWRGKPTTTKAPGVTAPKKPTAAQKRLNRQKALNKANKRLARIKENTAGREREAQTAKLKDARKDVKTARTKLARSNRNVAPKQKAVARSGAFTRTNRKGETVAVAATKAVNKKGNLRKGYSYDSGKAMNDVDVARIKSSGLSRKQQNKIINSRQNATNFGKSFGKSDVMRMQQAGMTSMGIAAQIRANPQAASSKAGRRNLALSEGQFKKGQYDHGDVFNNQDVKRMKNAGYTRQDIAKYVNANDINNKVGKRFQFKINPNNVGPNQAGQDVMPGTGPQTPKPDPQPDAQLDPKQDPQLDPKQDPQLDPQPDPTDDQTPDPNEWKEDWMKNFEDQLANKDERIANLENLLDGKNDIEPPSAEQNDPLNLDPGVETTPTPTPAPTNPETGSLDNLTPEQVDTLKDLYGLQDIPFTEMRVDPGDEGYVGDGMGIDPEADDGMGIDPEASDGMGIDTNYEPTETPTLSDTPREGYNPLYENFGSRESLVDDISSNILNKLAPALNTQAPPSNETSDPFGNVGSNTTKPQDKSKEKQAQNFLGDFVNNQINKPKKENVAPDSATAVQETWKSAMNNDYSTLKTPTMSDTPREEYKTIDTYQPSNQATNQPKVANDFVKSGSPKIQPLNPFTGLAYNLDASTGLTANPLQEMYSTIPGQLTSQGTIKGGYQPYVPEVPDIKAPTVNDVTVPTIPNPTQSPYQTQFEKDGMGYLPGQAGSKSKTDKNKFGSNYNNLVGTYNFIGS